MKLERYAAARNYHYKPFVTGVEIFDNSSAIGSDDFVVIAGGSGTGKSYLAMFIACNVARSGQRVLYINAEMFASVFVNRMVAAGFDFEVDFGKQDVDGHNRLMVVHQEDMQKKITYELIDEWVKKLKPDLLVVDLFGCLLPKDSSLAATTEKYAIGYSFYPRTYGCAVIVTEQLIKDYKFAERPDPHHIANGKALGDKSSKIITLYNYFSANPIKRLIHKSELVDRSLEIIIRKDRLGRAPLGIHVTDSRNQYNLISKVQAIEYENVVFPKQQHYNKDN